MFLYDNYNDLATYNPNYIECAYLSGFDQSKKNLNRHKKIEDNTAENVNEDKKNITGKFQSPKEEEVDEGSYDLLLSWIHMQ